MLTQNEFELWCERLKFSPETRLFVAGIRAAEPSRRVKSASGNVSGRYPSRKMGCTIQFESHRNELAAIVEFEHSHTIREYYDQPPAIKLNYRSKSGKALGVMHTPDFFVIEDEGAGWIECKTEEDLIRLAEGQPTRYEREEGGRWRCPPGEEYAARYGLSYRLKSSAEIDWRFQRNVLFLEDYLRAEVLEICEETVVCFQSLVAANPGITLADLLTFAAQHGLASDLLYILLATDRLYVDLRACVLAEPERVRVYYDEPTARRYEGSLEGLSHRNSLVKIEAGQQVTWDGRYWEIVNAGATAVWLRDEAQKVVSLPLSSVSDLMKRGQILAPPIPGMEDDRPRLERVRRLLAEAGPEDLAEANRRYRILNAYLHRAGADPFSNATGDEKISVRTIQRWSASYHQAEIQDGCGFIGLLPRISRRGNRQPRLPEATIEVTREFIKQHYEDLRQPNRFVVWAKLKGECEARGIRAPSYRTFCREVMNRPRHEQRMKRQGRRAAYELEEFYYELEMTTPRHGDRPFEIGHIDHSPLDIELVCSQTGKSLGRPWLTFMTDAYSRRFLAIYLAFDPPSYRSCMMVMRECVSRHHRLPQTIVMDGGKEFGSVYFEALLARYECAKKQRPSAKARFGSTCERLLGTTGTRFIYNLIGNTQLTRNNLRHVTKAVDPKNLAAWTYGALLNRLSEFAYEVYDTTDHPALGQSPREAFIAGLSQSGARGHRLIRDEEEFRLLTLPTTAKGKAKVIPGRGVRINYLYYWCGAFRDGEVEGRQVDVRYDPFDAGCAYAYVRRQWHQCLSEYYHVFHDRSERELMMATAELRRRHQNHQRRLTVTAGKLASFLKEVERDEALLIQRRRDAEVRAVSKGRKGPDRPLIPVMVDDGNQLQTNATFSPAPEREAVDLEDLEIYEEY
jgi:transposase InsO family protein